MADVRLSAAFSRNDRVMSLYTREVEVPGFELELLTLPPGEIFARMCARHAFDVSEMSLAALCALAARKDNPFVGVPAFVSRAFRHGMVYVRDDAGIDVPGDLDGKRIGIREWGMTAVVWIVGILAEHHGFDFRSARWLAARAPRVSMMTPPGMTIRTLPPGEDLITLLERGELDAAMVLEAPAAWRRGDGPVRRLFPDPHRAELDYFAATRLHPLMHAVVVRRDVHRQHPQLCERLYTALCAARRQALDAMLDSGVASAMLPMLSHAVDDASARFGEDYWPYGVEANRRELECLLRYAHQQALTPHELEPQALFTPEPGEG